LSTMPYPVHIAFNIFFMFLAIWGIYLNHTGTKARLSV
jgi:ABC-type multidrug transport system permease subunit